MFTVCFLQHNLNIFSKSVNKNYIPLCFVQERTDNVDKRRQDIEKANKKHAEFKKKRDNATNSRKYV